MSLWGITDALASAPKNNTRINTFSGASTDVVGVTANTITIADGHGFITGMPVFYSAGGGTAIAGLTTGTLYYAIRVDSFVVKLATTEANALAGTAIDLTAVGEGLVHTLQHSPANIYFVDSVEATISTTRAKGIKCPGWWSYKTWTNADGSVQHQAECLVAMQGANPALVPATTGDRSDDAVLPDAEA